jgi:hypothetical protein
MISMWVPDEYRQENQFPVSPPVYPSIATVLYRVTNLHKFSACYDGSFIILCQIYHRSVLNKYISVILASFIGIVAGNVVDPGMRWYRSSGVQNTLCLSYCIIFHNQQTVERRVLSNAILVCSLKRWKSYFCTWKLWWKEMFLESRARLVPEADIRTAICVPTVYTMWDPLYCITL